MAIRKAARKGRKPKKSRAKRRRRSGGFKLLPSVRALRRWLPTPRSLRRWLPSARTLRRSLPSARTRRRWARGFFRMPAAFQAAAGTAVVVSLWLAVNWTYQVARKPSELFFPVSGTLYKTPAETWRTYAPLFRRHSTNVITAEFLAALAQVEGSGNPIVRTYWRWAMTLEPFEIYRPASSAVGMYQITDGTFAEARRYCIHDHEVVEDGPWNDFRSCWFNALYTRVVPSHAIELTSAYLDRRVAEALSRHPVPGATLEQKQRLAAVIHLCGAGAGARYARQGLKWNAGRRCGTHDANGYVAKVEGMKARFARLEAEAAGGG